MAFFDTTWYLNSVGYAAVTVRPQNTVVAAGVLRRQFTTPTIGNERVFVCVVAGTTANVTDATWVVGRGQATTDGTVTWRECTGMAAVNGDAVNTLTWSQCKAAGNPTAGVIIKRNNGASYHMMTAGTGVLGASEPAFSDTAGSTVIDSGTTWTCLGVVGNFTAGGAPHARLANACASTWLVAGNTLYVGDNHAESQATAISITSTGVGTNTISKVLCHNRLGSYPPVAGDLTTGATISTTAAVNISWASTNNSFYVYGLTFKAGVGATATADILLAPQASANQQNWMLFDNCSFWIATTSAINSFIQVGQTGAFSFNICIFNNCTVKFANVNQFITPNFVQFIWQNTGQILAAGSSLPIFLIAPTGTSGNFNNVILEALDLSQITGAIWSGATNATLTNLLIKDCKVDAATTIVTPLSTGMNVQTVRCDSGATGYKSARYAFEGTETTETAITRVGGSIDPTGQAQSRKIVTTASAQWLRPFKAEPYAIWNSTTGTNVTVTIYGTINSASLPNNDDIWLEIEYLGSSATPLGKIVNTTKISLLANNAAVASDGSTWNGGGSGAGWSPFKLVATLSSPQPGMAGYIHVRVRAAKLSTTFYIDPQVVLT